jgi:hypothetical protein
MNYCVPFELYPPDVVTITDRISGTAFFPGGCGLFLEGRDTNSVQFPHGGVMIVGHNFDSEDGFNASLKRGKEKLTGGTWRTLIRLLEGASVPLDCCFFTNAFMGLCRGSNCLDYRGRHDQRFRTACASFLKAQIGWQRPRLIITLGLQVPPMMAEISLDLSCWTGSTPTLKGLDCRPILDAIFELNDPPIHRAVVVPIAHPSLPNNRNRKPVGFSPGQRGEVELIRAGWHQSRLV